MIGIEPGPTPQQLRVMAAYVRTGSQKAAAHECNLALRTVKNHMSDLYARLDVGGAIEALTKLGWLVPPNDEDRCSEMTVDLSSSPGLENVALRQLVPSGRAAILAPGATP
jgi:DNA-binding CsgD family transcriptional regulator